MAVAVLTVYPLMRMPMGAHTWCGPPPHSISLCALLHKRSPVYAMWWQQLMWFAKSDALVACDSMDARLGTKGKCHCEAAAIIMA